MADADSAAWQRVAFTCLCKGTEVRMQRHGSRKTGVSCVFAMEDNPNADDNTASLPTARQQVMSPRGAPADDHRTTSALPNGVPASGSRVHYGSDDTAYERALGRVLDGAVQQPSQEAAAEAAASDDAGRVVRASGTIRDGTPPSAPGNTVDRPLLPHAAVEPTMTTPLRAATATGLWVPSPFPSPLSTQGSGEATGSTGLLAQQGAAAMRWFSRLGEYVQRRATSHTRPGGESTATVEETVWSPGRARADREEEPLFSGRQLRRLRDMEGQAPQLYGTTVSTGGAGSEGSGSFSKEQLENEVRRQVELAMSGQRELADENLRLRQELEHLKATRRPGAGDVNAAERARMDAPQVHGEYGAPPGLEAGGGRVSISNLPPGLSGHNREHGGPVALFEPAKVPASNLSGHDDHGGRWLDQGGQLRGGALESSAGLIGQGSGVEQAADGFEPAFLGTSMKEVLQKEVESLRGNKGRESEEIPSGTSERGPEPRRRVGFSDDGGVLRDDRVSSSNLPGLSGHNRHGGRDYNIQHASSTSGPNIEQHASSTSGHTSWNLLGTRLLPEQPTRPSTTSAPEVSAGAAGTPMEALLKGMTQLQEAMAMQVGIQASRPEAIRPGVSGNEMPKLPEADEYAAINVGDWLHGLAGPMGDLTDGSSGWWASVIQSLEDYYKEFLTATTVRRVQLKAEDYAKPPLKDSRWARVDKRAATMLLQAVPESIKAELLANRLSTTLAILARILTIYRPGSSVERQQVLKALETPGSGNTAMELVEILRRWSRWLKRADDLGLQPPDASILLKGLDTATKQLLDRNPEVAFRTNMMRFSLDLDSTPTKTAVIKLHGHLLAECDNWPIAAGEKGLVVQHRLYERPMPLGTTVVPQLQPQREEARLRHLQQANRASSTRKKEVVNEPTAGLCTTGRTSRRRRRLNVAKDAAPEAT